MKTAGAPVKLLLVDDLEENLVALEALIRADGREIHCARSGEDALSLMLEHDFALAMVDVQMPSMSGFELAEMMRGTERTRRIPIIFVTAASRELNYAFRGYESGAVDFLYKPLEPMMVRGKVNVFVELYRQRQSLESTQAELERAVRMRDDFMSIVSHELRTPLNTLFLQAQLRQKVIPSGQIDAERLQRLAASDERQIRNMIRLIDDMLDVSRLRTGRLAIVATPGDLAVITRRAVDALSEQAVAAGCPVTVSDASMLPVVCDEFRIEQVLTNLLTNAFRYGRCAPVHVQLEARGNQVCATVRDRGPGIPPGDQQRIFAQFERGAGVSDVPGLGLGLFISRQIAQSHEGTLDVESTPGHGAAFRLCLPAGDSRM